MDLSDPKTRGLKALDDDRDDRDVERLPYAPPRITKKRSVARVTLFSGGGVSSTGLTASG